MSRHGFFLKAVPMVLMHFRDAHNISISTLLDINDYWKSLAPTIGWYEIFTSSITLRHHKDIFDNLNIILNSDNIGALHYTSQSKINVHITDWITYPSSVNARFSFIVRLYHNTNILDGSGCPNLNVCGHILNSITFYKLHELICQYINAGHIYPYG